MGWVSQQEGRRLYEERITLWRGGSAEEAIRRAETEAEAYASMIEEAPDTVLGLSQSFELFDEPGDGAEVFSLLRESAREPLDYLDRFFSAGAERSRGI